MRVDKFTLALMNRRLVLKTIWERGAINKAEIARRTGLSLPTAIKITDELLDNRIVRSCGRQEGASGKRPEMYEFAGDCYYSVGIDFAPTVLRALVMDLNGMPVAKANRPIPVPEDADAVIQTAAELIDQLLRESGIPLHRVLGVGVGVPGILDLDQGRVLFSPNFHWEDVALLEPLGRLLLQRTSIRWPMRLENSNRAMALGVGASGTSGELGHITVEKDGPLCTCGNNGCLEAVASGRAIAQQARNLISSGVKTRILELAGGNIERVEAKTVFAAAREQDVAALDLVRRAGEYIGIGIASYINLLDPEKIVLAGGMSNESLLIEQIQKVVKIRRMRFAGRRVKLRVSNLGEYGTAIGAAAIQLKTLLRQGGLSLTKEQEEAV